MKSYRLNITGWVLLCCLSPQFLWAQQPVSSVRELESRIDLGDVIRVIDQSGQRVQGRFAGISVTNLRLMSDGTVREFPEMTIREVQRRQPESRWDGVLYGAGIGAVVGLLAAQAECGRDTECAFYTRAAFVPMFAGLGSAAGALTDFAIRRFETVFLLAHASTQRYRVSPFINNRAKGIQLSVSF
jgi:hypothetical protein